MVQPLLLSSLNGQEGERGPVLVQKPTLQGGSSPQPLLPWLVKGCPLELLPITFHSLLITTLRDRIITHFTDAETEAHKQ